MYEDMGEEPPCENCEKPKLSQEELRILYFWRSLDGDRQIIDGMLLPIPTSSIITYLFQYNEGTEVLDLILEIDRQYITTKNGIEKQRRERERQKRQTKRQSAPKRRKR